MKISNLKWAGPLAKRLGLSVFLISIFVTILTSLLYLYIELKGDINNIEVQLDEVKDLYLPSIASRLWVAGLVLLLVSRRVTQHLGTLSTFARDLGLSNLD